MIEPTPADTIPAASADLPITTHKKRSRLPLWLGTGVAVFILGLVTWTWSSGAIGGGQPTSARIGSRAPAIELPQLVAGKPGERVALSAYAGRPVVVNFWATWCSPCRAEFPALEAKYRQYKDSKQLAVIGIASMGDDGPAAAQRFIESMGSTFPILLDTDGSAEQTYRVDALPTTVFIDRNGIIRDLVVGGPLTEEVLEKELAKIF